MSSEMAKIADDLDNFVHDLREDGNDASALWLEQRASALRRIAAAGEQKPVAWGRVIGGKAITISRERTPANDTPLYTAPPIPQPAAGWDEATRYLKKIAALVDDENACEPLDDAISYAGKALEALRRNPPSGAGVADIHAQYIVESILLRRIYQNKIDGYTLETSKEIVSALSNPAAAGLDDELADKLEAIADNSYYRGQPETGEIITAAVTALRSNPAAADSNASVEARLMEALGDLLNCVDGQHDYEWLARCKEKARKALYAYPHTSDCARDGETDCGATRCRDLGCFGACKPSDRTADVTRELCDAAFAALRESYSMLAFAFNRLHGSARSRDGELCESFGKVRGRIEKIFKDAGEKL